MKNLMTFTLIAALSGVFLLSGCTNWKKKYSGLDVEFQNLRGLYENCESSLSSSAAEKGKLGQELSAREQTIEALQRQIEERNISPDDASGFTGLDVDVDSAAGTITVTLPNSILFAPGKASLRQGTVAELDHIISVLRSRYGGKNIDVVGHTDSDPIRKSKKLWKDNWELSAQRALSVLRYLADNGGVSSERIRAVAAGASRAIASNSTSSGKAKNRRVEVVVKMR